MVNVFKVATMFKHDLYGKKQLNITKGSWLVVLVGLGSLMWTNNKHQSTYTNMVKWVKKLLDKDIKGQWVNLVNMINNGQYGK